MKTNQLKETVWMDEANNAIPRNRIAKHELKLEKNTNAILEKAQKANKILAEFKTKAYELAYEAYQEAMTSKGVDITSGYGKGNFTLFNFNRTIKIQVDINERIDFDDITIKAAKEKFNSFLEQTVKTEDDMIKQLVLDAFETSRGKLDVKKIFSLIRYESKIDNIKFQEAVKLLKESIRRPDSKTYMRVFVKDAQGKYSSVELNFSAL